MHEIRFRTARFNTTVVQPHFINDRCFGEDCAAWLGSALSALASSQCDKAWQEDWGWQFNVVVDGRKARVGVGVADDTHDWVILVEARAIDAPSVIEAIRQVLAAEGDIAIVQEPA